MAEIHSENTNLSLLFPVKEPSTYSEIDDVAQRRCVYPGERVLVAVSLEYTGTERCTDDKKIWRNRVQKLRVVSNNIVCFRAEEANDTRILGSIDQSNSLFITKNSNREQMDKHFKLCPPFASYSNGNCTRQRRPDLSEPIMIQDNRAVIPLVVTVNTSEQEADTAMVSVNVSSSPSSMSLPKEGFLDLFLKLPMQEVFDLHNDQWKTTVQAELPVVPPPEMKCRHVATGGKHFLILTVTNHYVEDLHITHLQVLVNKNEGLVLQGHKTNLLNTSKGVDSSNIELLLSKSSSLPVVLHPLEQHTFVFQLHISQEMWRNNTLLTTGIHIPLFLSSSWCTSSMSDNETISTHYALPTIRLDFPSFVMSAQCKSPVSVGESFHVTYTLLNNLQDFLGITLLWMPGNAPVAESDENSMRFIEEAVVCQQPTNQLGFCAKGSTATVTVPFQAIRPGLHELGKYMKLKLQYTQPPNSSNKSSPLERKDSSKFSLNHIARNQPPLQQLPRNLSVQQLSSGAPPPALSPSLPRRSHSLTGTETISGLGLNSNQKGVQRADSIPGVGGDPLNAWKVNLQRNSYSPVKSRPDSSNITSQTVSVDRIAKKKCQILVLDN
ncbi:trafficking protein particle complex subunit 14-like [Amphiura filiformis]|uniref:trafficking protein particle complex subunit 14-like n=1 Tax=Amphiura filiformis TaxID=82378 RepID=UPI003B2184A2